jgi:bla regulator protein blaR1
MSDLGAQVFAWGITAWVHGIVLFVIAWSAERMGLLTHAAVRQTAWRSVLLAPMFSAALQLFVLGGPLAGLQSLVLPAPPSTATVRAAASPPLTAEPPTAPAGTSAEPPARARLAVALGRAPIILGWAWLAWMLGSALRLGVQRVVLARYRRRLAAVDEPETAAMAEALRREAGLDRLALLEDRGLSGPIALAPSAIVLPAWAAGLTALQRRALIAHEVRHLARRDPQWRAATGLAACVLLAPHGRAVLARLETLAEHACDAWSAERTGGGAALVQCLAACLERGLGGRAPRWASAMAAGEPQVVERTRRLLEGRLAGIEPAPWRERAVFAAILVVTATVLPGFAIGRAAVAPVASDPTVPAPAARAVGLASARPVAATAADAPQPPAPQARAAEPAPASHARDVTTLPALPALEATPAPPAPSVPPTPLQPLAVLPAVAALPVLPAIAIPPTPPTEPAAPAPPTPPA